MFHRKVSSKVAHKISRYRGSSHQRVVALRAVTEVRIPVGRQTSVNLRIEERAEGTYPLESGLSYGPLRCVYTRASGHAATYALTC